jgi:hypothetical protein
VCDDVVVGVGVGVCYRWFHNEIWINRDEFHHSTTYTARVILCLSTGKGFVFLSIFNSHI